MPQKHDIGHQKRAKNKAAAELKAASKADSRHQQRATRRDQRQAHAATVAASN